MNRLGRKLGFIVLLWLLAGAVAAQPLTGTGSDCLSVVCVAPESADADARRQGYRWRGPPANSSQSRGLARDTGYFLIYQAAVVGALYAAPESISSWSDEDKAEFSFAQWRENAGHPNRDEDTHLVNYVGHPYWGATYYVRGRERGLTGADAFWFSAFLSTLFEFGMEALFEQPSYQDLWTTPVLGSLIGEYGFSPLRAHIRAKPGPLAWHDKVLLTITDPLGVVGTETDRRLGITAELRLHTFSAWRAQHNNARLGSNPYPPAGDPQRPASVLGVQLRIRW